ncbi:MAG: hypothetical protein U0531_18985 [Dehalococcoidia bacterium]
MRRPAERAAERPFASWSSDLREIVPWAWQRPLTDADALSARAAQGQGGLQLPDRRLTRPLVRNDAALYSCARRRCRRAGVGLSAALLNRVPDAAGPNGMTPSPVPAPVHADALVGDGPIAVAAATSAFDVARRDQPIYAGDVLSPAQHGTAARKERPHESRGLPRPPLSCLPSSRSISTPPQAHEVLVRMVASGVRQQRPALRRRLLQLPPRRHLATRRRHRGGRAAGGRLRAGRPRHRLPVRLLRVTASTVSPAAPLRPPSRAAQGRGFKPSWQGTPVNQFANLSSYAEQMLVHENATSRSATTCRADRAALIGCGVRRTSASALR